MCAELLPRILQGLDIDRVELPEKQKTISEGLTVRSVRLDIFTRTFSTLNEKTLHDLEMETRNRGWLPRRTRGYHIQGGDEGRHIYSFTNRCAEDPKLELNDGAHTIFLNAYGTLDDVSPKLKAFLDFVKGVVSDDPFVRKLETRVREAKKRDDWRREFMTLSMWEQEKFEEGLSQGRSEAINAAEVL